MSHTTTINTLLLSDEHAIRAAVAELKSKGVNIDLAENAVPRSYPGNPMKQAPMVIKCNEAKYDVGLYKNKDGTYAAATDFYGGSVAKQLGTPVTKDMDGTERQQAQLGKFYQAYGVHAATRQAAKQGYSVRRVNRDDGSVQLVVTA